MIELVVISLDTGVIAIKFSNGYSNVGVYQHKKNIMNGLRLIKMIGLKSHEDYTYSSYKIFG